MVDALSLAKLQRHGLTAESATQMRGVIHEVVREPKAATHECSTLIDLDTGQREGPILCLSVGVAFLEPHVSNMRAGRRYLFMHSHPNSASFSAGDAANLWSPPGDR